MERFDFELFEPLLSELRDRLNAIEAPIKNHLEAVNILADQIDEELPRMPKDPDRWSWFMVASKQLRAYIEQCQWFELEGYPPRIRKEDFDFEAECKRSKELETHSRQIQYLEQVLKEFRAFAGKFSTRQKYEFGERLQAEIKRLKMETAIFKKPDGEKLVWQRKTAEFGHLFSELFHLQYLGFADGEEINYRRLARICLELFEFEDKPSNEYLANQLNPEKNALSPDSKKRFIIPDTKELNPKKAKKPKGS